MHRVGLSSQSVSEEVAPLAMSAVRPAQSKPEQLPPQIDGSRQEPVGSAINSSHSVAEQLLPTCRLTANSGYHPVLAEQSPRVFRGLG